MRGIQFTQSRSTGLLKKVLRPLYWKLRRGAWQAFLRTRWLAIRALRIAGCARDDENPLRGFHASTRNSLAVERRRGRSEGFYHEIDPAPSAYRSEPSVLEARPGARPPLSGPLSVPIPQLFVASIPHGRVYGEAAAVIAPDGKLLVDACGIHPLLPFKERKAHPVWRAQSFPTVRVLPGQVAVLAALLARYYFHWMFNVLPRFELLRLAGVDVRTLDLFIVNQPSAPFQQETLAQLGLTAPRLLFTGEGFHVQADRLWVTSSLRFSGHRTPAVLTFLRREFLAHDGPPSRARTRLYVSRADAAWRRLLNEDECLDQLRPLGFEKVVLGTMSVREQALRFSTADVVVAPHGSGLTNLVFCDPATKVVELCSPAELPSHYMNLSQCRGLDHHWVVGEPASEGPWEDFRLDPNTLVRALRTIGIR
ncbi:MAG TPA: glycosyltransferase family 61 protein [Candidatus Methylomirabilis sp.]|nr:glycosyltransferase family 61 protein [Candidatus Methylomirabilis sp.]